MGRLEGLSAIAGVPADPAPVFNRTGVDFWADPGVASWTSPEARRRKKGKRCRVLFVSRCSE